MRKLFFVAIALIGLTLFYKPLNAQPVCNSESLPKLPDVTITTVTQEAQPAPHCKVAGVIGSEIHFELLLPDIWNGKKTGGTAAGYKDRKENDHPDSQSNHKQKQQVDCKRTLIGHQQPPELFPALSD